MKPLNAQRRGLFIRVGRLAAIGALASAVSTLLMRRQITHRPCDRQSICRGCGKVTDCVLPQAMSFRTRSASTTADTSMPERPI
jgi:hypothetical protein